MGNITEQKIKNLFKTSKKPISIILGGLVGIALILAFPLTLVYGLHMIGFEEVKVSVSSYCGSILILFYLALSNRISRPSKEEDNESN
jgi:hypothetical protein